MTSLTPPADWYLFDYGMVISTAPDPEDWLALREATGLDLEHRESSYWVHRSDFDAGRLTSRDYWTRVLGQEVNDGFASRLDALDARQWSHFNLDTLDVLESLSAGGSGLALLSNMPAGMASEFVNREPWVRYFDKLFFSGHLGLVKPDPAVFAHVLAELEADGGRVTFVDDSEANIAAAKALGFRTVLHTEGIDLAARLTLLDADLQR
ncbi:MAG: HAD family phosphatase [Actinomycetota bacterium]|nr:HAD family phosphatase [Actinomycetota bacterium]